MDWFKTQFICTNLLSMKEQPIKHIIYFVNAVMPCPGDNFGTVVGENQTPYGILSMWAVNGLSIVCWVHRAD